MSTSSLSLILWSFAALVMFLASGLSVSGICHYIEEQCERSMGHLVVVVATS